MLLGPVGQKGRFQGNSNCTLRKQGLSCPARLLESRLLQRNTCLESERHSPWSLPIWPSTHSEDTPPVPVCLRATLPVSDVLSYCHKSTHTCPSAYPNLWSGKVGLDVRGTPVQFVFPLCSSRPAAWFLFGARWK